MTLVEMTKMPNVPLKGVGRMISKMMIIEPQGVRNLFESRGAYNVDRFSAKKLYDSIYVGEFPYKAHALQGGIVTFPAGSKIDFLASKFNHTEWTVTKALHSHYKDLRTGLFFDENSISVEIVGIDNDALIEFAKEMSHEFQQQSVLVKSYSTQDIWFVENLDGI